MGRPLITGESPTVRKAMIHGQHLLLCQRANPHALAEAVLVLRADPALGRRLADRGHSRFQERFATTAIGRVMREHLTEVQVNDTLEMENK